MVFILGLMEEDLKDNGLIIIWMGKDFTNGKMEEVIKEVTFMIKNKDTVFIFGYY